MTNRDRTIKQAFEEGFFEGYRSVDRDEADYYVENYAKDAFERWSRHNATLLDGEPDLESRIADLEAKLERAQNLIEEM